MKTTNTYKSLKKQAGVTLMELIVGLTVMAMIVGGALALYRSAMSSQATTQLLQDLTAMRASVKQMWQGQGSFGPNGTNLNAVLVSAKRVPTTISVNSSSNPPILTHVANGTMNVTSAVTFYDVTITEIGEDLCIPLLTGATGWHSITVGSTAAITDFPVTPLTATTACATGTTLVFRGS